MVKCNTVRRGLAPAAFLAIFPPCDMIEEKAVKKMENMEYVLDSQLRNMLSKYPDQKELSVILIQEIAELFREDFDAIAQKNKRIKTVSMVLFPFWKKPGSKM